MNKYAPVFFYDLPEAISKFFAEVISSVIGRKRDGYYIPFGIQGPEIRRVKITLFFISVYLFVIIRKIQYQVDPCFFCKIVCIGRAVMLVVTGRCRSVQGILTYAAGFDTSEIGKCSIIRITGTVVLIMNVTGFLNIKIIVPPCLSGL